MASHIALISVTRWRLRGFNITYFPARYLGATFEVWDLLFYIAPCNGLQGAVGQYATNQTRNTGANPLLFSISALGSFTCVTQHTGPTALRPIQRTKQSWLSVLLKDTSVATGTQTHTLTIRNTRAWVRCSYPLSLDTPSEGQLGSRGEIFLHKIFSVKLFMGKQSSKLFLSRVWTLSTVHVWLIIKLNVSPGIRQYQPVRNLHLKKKIVSPSNCHYDRGHQVDSMVSHPAFHFCGSRFESHLIPGTSHVDWVFSPYLMEWVFPVNLSFFSHIWNRTFLVVSYSPYKILKLALLSI